MDKKIEQIIDNVKYNRSMMSDDIIEMLDKDSMAHNKQVMINKVKGESVHFTFICPNCKAEHHTQKQYQINFNPIQQFLWDLKNAPSDLIGNFLEDTIGQIPWVGDTITWKRDEKTADTRSDKFTVFVRKSKVKAWEQEMKHVIKKCSNCDSYGCPECMNDQGTCENC